MTRSRPRPGFTVGEVLVALAVLAAATALAAEAAVQLAADRSRLEARQEAAEAAANALEAARAVPWDQLTPEWATGRPAPPGLARWPGGKLAVTVAPEKDRPRVKRVTATVTWDRPGEPWPATTLTTLIAARAAGGKP